MNADTAQGSDCKWSFIKRRPRVSGCSFLGSTVSVDQELLIACPLYTVRPSHYLFVKAHLFVWYLAAAIRNMGGLSNTDASLMESYQINDFREVQLT